jgi:NADH-quinone oxidoreductase subunit G
LRALSAYIAAATGAAFNRLPHGGNAAGGRLAGAVPHHGPGGCEALTGMNTAQMLEAPRRCYLLWGIEPDYDIDNPARAMNALRQADTVISVVSHASESLREISDVILPLAAQPESEGSMVNLDGSVMSFKAAGKAPGEARPGWKILHRIGTEMGLEGFGQINVEDVLGDLLTARDNTPPASGEPSLTVPGYENALYRTGELPMYSIDMLCRRSEPLQQTQQAHSAFIGLNPEDAARLGLDHGVMARVSQGGSQAEFEVLVSSRVPAGGVWLRSATPATREFGPAVAPISVEVA